MANDTSDKAGGDDRSEVPADAAEAEAEIEISGEDVDFTGDEASQEIAAVERTSHAAPIAPALRGDFDHKAFPELLAELHRQRETGALLLRREKVKKIVYFREGVAQFVKSNLLSECLGRVLTRERMISEADCDESLRRMKAMKRRQGAVLVDMGCISPHNLAYALNLQLRFKLFDVFTWRSGDYAFDRRASVPPEAVTLELTPAQCIYEGVRRAYDAERLAAALGDVEALYVHPAPEPLWALAEVALGQDEHELLQQIDGRKTVARLRELGLLSPLDTTRLLYAMRCGRAVELRPEAAAGGAETASEPELPPLADIDISPPPQPDAPPPPPAPIAAALPLEDEPLVAPALPPTPPPLPRLPKKHTVPFRGVDTQPMSVLLDIPLPGESSPALPELSVGAHAQENESVVRARLARRAAAMSNKDHFEVLGLPRDATDAQVAQAYQALARENHPDLFGSASAEIRQLAKQIYNLLSTAHETLRDAKERERYLARLAIAESSQSALGEDVGQTLAAEARFQKGEELLRQGELAQAVHLFEEAVALYGQEGEFHALLGWSRFQLAPADPAAHKQALDSLERALQLNPKSDRAHLFTGHLYKALGKPELAQQHFEKAIQANPDNAEAVRELSLLNWAAHLGGARR